MVDSEKKRLDALLKHQVLELRIEGRKAIYRLSQPFKEALGGCYIELSRREPDHKERLELAMVLALIKAFKGLKYEDLYQYTNIVRIILKTDAKLKKLVGW